MRNGCGKKFFPGAWMIACWKATFYASEDLTTGVEFLTSLEDGEAKKLCGTLNKSENEYEELMCT